MRIDLYKTIFVSGLLTVLLSGCSGGAGFAQPDGRPANFTVGGAISGLSGAGLVLQNNGKDNLTQSTDGSFTFATGLARGSSYTVTVLSQPSGQICTVNNGTGINITSNVTSVSVICSAQAFSVGGNVSGLNPGQKIVIKNNGADPITITSNTAFTFATPIAYGSAYAVTVSSQPVGQTCTVTNGALSNVTANVANVAISCSAASYAVLYSYGTITNDALAPTNANVVQASDGNFYGMAPSGGANGDGAIFKITPLGVEAVLYSFDASGFGPYLPDGSGLTIGSDGNFYGTTSRGGIDDCGTVFKITPAGVFTLLHQFIAAVTDGCQVTSGLTLATDGFFYGTTAAGGANGLGTAFKISPTGTESLLYSFGATGTDANTPTYSNLVQYSDGNFYGTTYSGGTYSAGTVYKLTPGGVETILHAFGFGPDGANPRSGLSVGADGNFYGNTFLGGGPDNGTVFKLTPTGTETVLHSFAGGVTDGARPIGSNMVLGSDGNFYSMTSAGGAFGNGVLYSMTPAGTVTILHSFAGGASDGATPRMGITIGTDGYIYGTTSAGGAFGQGVFFRF